MWQDYLSFIKKTVGALASDQARRAGLLRTVYHAAVMIPMHGVEALWREYDAFENEIHKQNVSQPEQYPDVRPVLLTCQRSILSAAPF